ncbi:MAG: adenine phosphoribosyltransferase, partial [Gemmatimonadota bacterium]
LLADKDALAQAIDDLARWAGEHRPEIVVGGEARGFLIGAALAYRLGAGFVPVRKPKKLPAECERIEYELEYGTDALEAHADALGPGDRVVLVDDLLATGGTARAGVELVRSFGCELVAVEFLVELAGLEGRRRLEDVEVHALLRL